MDGGPITTVAPSTTATALTSITTGLPPGEHGVVGYRMAFQGDVLNVLRWSTPPGDARRTLPPGKIQPPSTSGGQRPPVLPRTGFATSGFTCTHLHEPTSTRSRTLRPYVARIRQECFLQRQS